MKISNSLKKLQKHKKHVYHVPHSSRACGTVLSLQTSLSLTRNMKVKVAIELLQYFPKYQNLDTGNFSLILRPFKVLLLMGR